MKEKIKEEVESCIFEKEKIIKVVFFESDKEKKIICSCILNCYYFQCPHFNNFARLAAEEAWQLLFNSQKKPL